MKDISYPVLPRMKKQACPRCGKEVWQRPDGFTTRHRRKGRGRQPLCLPAAVEV